MADYSEMREPLTEEEKELIKKVTAPARNGFSAGRVTRTIKYVGYDTPVPDYWTCNTCGAMVALETWEKHRDWHVLMALPEAYRAPLKLPGSMP